MKEQGRTNLIEIVLREKIPEPKIGMETREDHLTIDMHMKLPPNTKEEDVHKLKNLLHRIYMQSEPFIKVEEEGVVYGAPATDLVEKQSVVLRKSEEQQFDLFMPDQMPGETDIFDDPFDDDTDEERDGSLAAEEQEIPDDMKICDENLELQTQGKLLREEPSQGQKTEHHVGNDGCGKSDVPKTLDRTPGVSVTPAREEVAMAESCQSREGKNKEGICGFKHWGMCVLSVLIAYVLMLFFCEEFPELS